MAVAEYVFFKVAAAVSPERNPGSRFAGTASACATSARDWSGTLRGVPHELQNFAVMVKSVPHLMHCKLAGFSAGFSPAGTGGAPAGLGAATAGVRATAAGAGGLSS